MRSLLMCVILLEIVLVLTGIFGDMRRSWADSGLANEYLVVKADIGGAGYNQFFPQPLVVNQGDSVNITIRNLSDQSFQFSVENLTTANVEAGISASNGSVTPVDSAVPVFVTSKPGIFRFSASNSQDMVGYMVVLPTDWNAYNPQAQNRILNSLILPDLGGDGYDKFFPQLFVVNQNDNVTLKFRSMDEHSHGLALPAYNIDMALNPGQMLPNGTITPLTTEAPKFTASIPGIFTFECTVPCGPGHIQMIGTLVVLPRAGTQYNPVATTMYEFLVAAPDFAGDGYDKYIPAMLFVNQGDEVYIVVRNTDVMPHGFTLTAFNINNVTITPANQSGPTDTYLPPFVASKTGIFEYFCTIPCGPGHYQMIGYLAVLPKSTQTSTEPVETSGVSLTVAIMASLLLLILGFIGGLILATKEKDLNTPA